MIILLTPLAVAGQDYRGPKNLKSLCYWVDGRTKDLSPDGDFEYQYQRDLYEAAGITSKDTDEEVVEKMRTFWKKWGPTLTCSNTKFDITNGSVIKFAVSSLFTPFLEDVVHTWKLDLNVIDVADGKTILDYIEGQIVSSKGTTNEKTLIRYREVFVQAGAKHAKEIKNK